MKEIVAVEMVGREEKLPDELRYDAVCQTWRQHCPGSFAPTLPSTLVQGDALCLTFLTQFMPIAETWHPGGVSLTHRESFYTPKRACFWIIAYAYVFALFWVLSMSLPCFKSCCSDLPAGRNATRYDDFFTRISY